MAGGSGLLGGAQQNPPIMERPRQQQGGAMNALGQVFGGQNDPNLSAEQNEQAQKQALMQAGLATILSSRGGMNAPGLMQVLAQGALAGQQGGTQARQQMAQQGQQEQLQQMIAQTPREQLPQLAQQLVAQGHMDQAKVVLDIANATKPGPGRAPLEVKIGEETVFIDRDTMQEIARFGPSEEQKRAAARAREAESAAEVAEINFERTDKLADDFRSETSEDRTVATNYGTVLASAQDPSAAGDLSLIFAYMKMVDPGSVVRESEFATAQNAPGVPERVRAQFNRILEGERFTPESRQDFVDRATRLAKARRREFNQTLDHYRTRAQRAGVDASGVVRDYYGNLLGEADDPFGDL